MNNFGKVAVWEAGYWARRENTSPAGGVPQGTTGWQPYTRSKRPKLVQKTHGECQIWAGCWIWSLKFQLEIEYLGIFL